MYIPKDKPIRPKRLLLALSVLSLVVVGMTWLGLKKTNNHPLVDNQSIEVATASVGTFEHNISAFGLLKSNAERVVMNRVSGAVSQLYIKPGAVVTPEQVIIELTNSTIERNLVDAQFELEAAQVQFALKKAAIDEEELKLRNEAQLVKADLSILQAELAAHENLADRKIISKFDYEKVKSQLQKNQLRDQLAQQQLDNFVANKPIKLRANEFELAKAKRALEVAELEHASLQVTAGMAGVLKSLDDDIALGAWLNKDAKVGQVTNINNLYAEIEVNAAEAVSLNEGMRVFLNVKGQSVEGTITRIAPNVVNNRVQVDASLTSALPKTARPEVEVSAKIVAKQIPNTLLLSRPAWLNVENGKAALYVKPVGSDSFQRRLVTIGAMSQTALEVIDGLNAEEQVIMTNTLSWSQDVINIQG